MPTHREVASLINGLNIRAAPIWIVNFAEPSVPRLRRLSFRFFRDTTCDSAVDTM